MLANKTGIFVAAIIIFFLAVFVIQTLWNMCLVPAINGVNEISYFQALGLHILFLALFGRATDTLKN